MGRKFFSNAAIPNAEARFACVRRCAGNKPQKIITPEWLRKNWKNSYARKFSSPIRTEPPLRCLWNLSRCPGFLVIFNNSQRLECLRWFASESIKSSHKVYPACTSKNLWHRKCVRRWIFRNVEVSEALSTLISFATWPLGHCVTCKVSYYATNEYNHFYQNYMTNIFLFDSFFEKKQYFPRRSWKTVSGAYLTMF